MTREQRAAYMREYAAAFKGLGICTSCRNDHSGSGAICSGCVKKMNGRRRGPTKINR